MTVMVVIIMIICMSAGDAKSCYQKADPPPLYPREFHGKWGFTKKNDPNPPTIDDFIIPPQFDEAGSFSEGLASVCIGDYIHRKCGYIDMTGKMIIQPRFDAALLFHDGLAQVFVGAKKYGSAATEGGMWGYIDKTGNFAIKQFFDRVSDFKDGLAVVREYDPTKTDNTWKYGFIDKSGRYVIPPRFLTAGQFQEGLAAVSFNFHYYGFIDKSGKFVIKPKFQEVTDFKNGLAGYKGGGKWGYINTVGQVVIQAQFDEVSPFELEGPNQAIVKK